MFGVLVPHTAQTPVVPEVPQEAVVVVQKEELSVEELIMQYFPEDYETAVAVAKCESGLRPDALGPTNDEGVFQIHIPSHGERLEELGLDPLNAEDNIKFARILYDERGWTPWVCYTKNLI